MRRRFVVPCAAHAPPFAPSNASPPPLPPLHTRATPPAMTTCTMWRTPRSHCMCACGCLRAAHAGQRGEGRDALLGACEPTRNERVAHQKAGCVTALCIAAPPLFSGAKARRVCLDASCLQWAPSASLCAPMHPYAPLCMPCSIPLLFFACLGMNRPRPRRLARTRAGYLLKSKRASGFYKSCKRRSVHARGCAAAW